MSTTTFFQDNSRETYECTGTVCGYAGTEYCQNCGFEADEVAR